MERSRQDELIQAMGLSGIAKSTASKPCKDIDERVNAFLERPLEGEWPYLWLDATYLKVRDSGRIISVAAIIAVAVNAEGRREIVGLHLGRSEAETFWSTFLRSLVKRGLKGVKLVVSDAHEGLKAAIWRVLGATWQRCRVHRRHREGRAAVPLHRGGLARRLRLREGQVGKNGRQCTPSPAAVAAARRWEPPRRAGARVRWGEAASRSRSWWRPNHALPS